MLSYGLKVVPFLLLILIVYISCEEIEISNGDADEEQMFFVDEEEVQEDLEKYVETGKPSRRLAIALETMKEKDFFSPQTNIGADFARAQFPSGRCLLCRGTLGFLLTRRRFGDSRENLAKTGITLCQTATSYSPEVCSGVVELNIDTILYIFDNRPKINQDSFCALIFQQECGKLDESLDFHVDIVSESTKTRTCKSIQHSTSEDMKIIQFTDVHFDPLYVVGGDANCNDPLCCRKPTSSDANKAGYWGDYRKCDMPLHTLEYAIKHIAEQHPDADFIYYTGDFVPHNVWNTTIESNIEVMDKMYQVMKEAFGDKTIYPILGNHEVHPVNVFSPSSIKDEKFSSAWLYNYTASIWSTWLPKETIPTILKGGYYTVLIKPGFRLIALNNNDCYIYNWWVLYSVDEVKEQLQWLHDTLLAAERNNEKVHILAHIPSGDGSCFKYWSREYRRIIERFHKIISAQFNGHSHYNEFNVFYETNNISNPINVAWNGGSLTTYFDVNPNFNVYHVNGNDLQVSDYEGWIFNITEANQNPDVNPPWYKQFSFKNNFKIPDLSPLSLDNLLEAMTTVRSVANIYFKQKIKDGDPFLEAGCQDKCLQDHACEISVNEVGDNRRCRELRRNSFTSD